VVRLFLFDPVAHLGRGLVGEGEGQDLVCWYSLVCQMEVFFCYDSRFAGTWAGEDELEAVGCDGGLLGGIKGAFRSWIGGGDV
jgi:hypothetical protein